MDTRSVATVFGGSGFLGRYVVKRLAAAGYITRVAVRDPEGAMFLRPMGRVGQIVPMYASLAHEATVARAVEGAELVVNLVGILAERRAGDFTRMQAEGAGRIAALAAAAGRQPHGAGLRDRRRPGQPQPVRPHQGGGRGGRAGGDADGHRAAPLAGVRRGGQVLQPLRRHGAGAAVHARHRRRYADAAGLRRGRGGRGDGRADRPAHGRRTYELGGPRVWTFREILAYILRETRRKRPLIDIPMGLARFQASIAEKLPTKPFTRDQLLLLSRDNVVAPGMPGLAQLGIAATPVELVVPEYLDRYRPGGGKLERVPA